MLLRNYRRHLVAGLGLALACDERYTVATTVTLPDEVAAAYTPSDRGLVVVSIRSDADRDVRVVGVVCGEGDTYRVSTGGFGDLPEAEVQAWIEPLPADDDRSGLRTPEVTFPSSSTASHATCLPVIASRTGQRGGRPRPSRSRLSSSGVFNRIWTKLSIQI